MVTPQRGNASNRDLNTVKQCTPYENRNSQPLPRTRQFTAATIGTPIERTCASVVTEAVTWRSNNASTIITSLDVRMNCCQLGRDTHTHKHSAGSDAVGMSSSSSSTRSRGKPSTWVFYFVQGQAGESADHPNVFRVPKHVDELRLKDIQAAFPLSKRTRGRFHFRFKVAAVGDDDGRSSQRGKHCYMDLVHPDDIVPTFEKHVHVKALQLGGLALCGCCGCGGRVIAEAMLRVVWVGHMCHISRCCWFVAAVGADTLRCASQRTNHFLRRRVPQADRSATGSQRGRVGQAAAPGPRVVTGQVEPSLAPLRRAESDGGPASAPPPPARPRRSQTVGAVDPRRGHPSAQYAPSPTETPQPQQPPSASPPPPPAPSPPAPSPPASAGRPSPAPTPISSPASMVPVPEHTVADTPVDMPEHIDEDLRNSGKSDFVIAGIQRRRDAAAAREAVRVVQGGAPCGCCVRIWSSTWSSTCGHSQANALPLLQARIKAISDREAKAQEEERNRHDAQQELGAKLDAWRLGSNGQMNDIRVLLCNLDSVLWEGARWKPVKMGELIDTKKVHLKYKRACAVVHPDKNMNAPFMQRYTAERIFEALNEAHKSV